MKQMYSNPPEDACEVYEWYISYCCVLTLKGSCVQTLGQTKKASHFEVDLETKHNLARNGIRVRQQTIFMNIMRF